MEDVNLYMKIEIEKMRQNHVDGIWTYPCGLLAFNAIIIKTCCVIHTRISKSTIHDKWTSDMYDICCHELVDMVRTIQGIEIICACTRNSANIHNINDIQKKLTNIRYEKVKKLVNAYASVTTYKE